LSEQETRRITLKRLWNEEKNLPCFETLVALSRELHSSGEESTTQKDPFSNVLLTITYTDEDGDSIIISSDEELADAFEQFVTKDPPVVRAFLSDDKKNKSHNPYSNHHIAASTTSSSSHSTSTTNHHHHNSNLMKLQQLKAQKRDIMMQIAQEQWNETKQCMKNEIRKTATTTSADCTDTPPTTPPTTTQTDMEATEKNTINVQETSDPLENKQDSDTSSIATTTLPEKQGYPLAFIHGRHTCDGCFTTPIIGIRYHAVNLPDYDLCQNCVQNYKGSDIVFQPEQLERDIPLQERWRQRFTVSTSRKKDMCRSYGTTTPCHRSTLHAHHRMQGTNNDLNNKREDIRNMSHNVAANVLGAAIKGVRRVGHEIMEDAAFKEAVRRSLLISQPLSKEEKETEPLHQDKVVKNTSPNSNIVEVESVSEESMDETEDKNVMNPSMEKVVVESPIQSLTTENILMEPLDELILNEETVPIPSNVDETADDNAGSEKDVEDHDHTNLYETSATIILHGQDTADEMSLPHSPDTVEKGEWQVLDKNGEDITQKEFARAAQMLGSALYHSAQNESNMSSLTSVPTIESCNTNISPVVLATWRDELDMLRELGFSNDGRNVEVLERLQAANIGCERDEKVSVERAANILLNENVRMAP
jgi:hypothetical protein